jgi:hypothetical protein
MLGLNADGVSLLLLCVSDNCWKYVRNEVRDMAMLVDYDVFVTVEIFPELLGSNDANVLQGARHKDQI